MQHIQLTLIFLSILFTKHHFTFVRVNFSTQKHDFAIKAYLNINVLWALHSKTYHADLLFTAEICLYSFQRKRPFRPNLTSYLIWTRLRIFESPIYNLIKSFNKNIIKKGGNVGKIFRIYIYIQVSGEYLFTHFLMRLFCSYCLYVI